MNDQKNLILAIVISVFIIVIFQFLFPQQTMIIPEEEISTKQDNQTLTSIDQTQEININKKINRDDIIKKIELDIKSGERILIKNENIIGSIRLKGAIIDDLILTKYKDSLDENSKNIQLFSPNDAKNPYYIEIGWKQLSNDQNIIDLPNDNTIWSASSNQLSPNNPINLNWINNQNIEFNIKISVDNEYMFNIDQEIINNSSNKISLFPYRFIKRINEPDTIGFFILHEGLISLSNEELLEKDYDDLIDDCSSQNNQKSDYCNKKSKGGWLGFTDKYWLAALIPNQSEEININYRHNINNETDDFRAGYAGNIINIEPKNNIKYSGKLFAGAKVVKILDKYQNQENIIRFNDAIDWGWFSFLTKPIFYSINWFYQKVGNFGLAIIAFTILMRIVLFPLAQASFKSMAKMKKLQPEIQRLKELHGDDRQKMQQDLMAMYKKEGANPVAGCLPIVLQIPIFFALYKTLFVTIEMYHAPFYGWIHDLSAPDPAGILILFGLINSPNYLSFVNNYLSLVNIGVLPIIMGISMYLQQKLNPAPADPVQAKIFTLLPIVFTFILAGFAAGLVLYWSVNNILSILQQWIIQRKIIKQS
tara:strand:- start:656 stop:2431 length:1776 start_codon:yes stop_codon:yes gene_type:complete